MQDVSQVQSLPSLSRILIVVVSVAMLTNDSELFSSKKKFCVVSTVESSLIITSIVSTHVTSWPETFDMTRSALTGSKSGE